LRHAYLTEYLLHDVAQTAMKVVIALLLLAWLGSWLDARLARWRRALGYLLLSALIGVGLVNLGKQLTNVDCPWDLQAFGGDRVFYGLFDARLAEAPAGHCFPGGHSSSGFALFGLFFLLRRRRPSQAWLGLLPALLLGGTFAVVQWMRGAHFPSHDLTTAYLCWLTALAGDYWLLRPRE
jgi:membrane-associated PAP2 superfamily phosphatase